MKLFRAKFSYIFVALSVAVQATSGVLAQTLSSQDALLAKYRCPLSDLLRQVFEAPSAYQERNRYLILTGPGRSADYVQCIFAANRTKLYCEASSGYYDEAMDKPRRHFPSDAVKAALGKLGFKTGNEEKNYPYERDFTGTPDFGEIATLMLSAMHDGFGARAETPLIVHAPFAKKVSIDCKAQLDRN
ncbi:MAG: hypothetical protein EKK40_16140 [Bradyrhizobiaceae bacterium]|nr:MAG: hypothetical protein EKK40_16140 [Bradyrhizobiaceae bacterium]